MSYIFGRFSGGLVATLFVFSGTGLGAIAASFMPFTGSAKIAAFSIWPYTHAYFIGVLPNLFFVGALIFTAVILTRKFMTAYMTVIILLVSFYVGFSLWVGDGRSALAEVFDPFGYFSARRMTAYWSLAQKNELLIPLTGTFLLNRLFLVGLGGGLIFLACIKFNFSNATTLRKKQRSLKAAQTDVSSEIGLNITNLPPFQREDSLFASLSQMFCSAKREFTGLTHNRYFLTILLLGIVLILFQGFSTVGLTNGVLSYPLTSQVLAATKASHYLFSLAIILFVSGELVWRERQHNIHELFDSLPIANGVAFASKLLAIGACKFYSFFFFSCAACLSKSIRASHNLSSRSILKNFSVFA